jgi:secondary thiamine-phosphate synthase enzyme
LPTYSGELALSTAGDGDVLDITPGVEGVVRDSGIADGLVSVFVVGSTAAITTMEFERGGVEDLRATLDRLIPREGDYEHNRLNHDTNSHAHQRASIVGPSETIPLREGQLRLGIWQQLVLVDFDDRPRERSVVVSVLS